MAGEGEQEKQEQQKQEQNATGGVNLSKEEYAEMVNNINTMKATIEEFVRESAEKSEQREAREKQAEEERRQRAEQGDRKPLDLDLLSNKQLAAVIFNEVQGKIAKPMLEMISLMAVKDEKRDLEKYLSKQGKDIEDYEEEIIKIATDKPSLSLMEAYKIIEQERSQKANDDKKRKEEEEKRKEEAKGSGGERPGAGKFSLGGKLSLDEAGDRAFKELKDTFPE